MLVPIDTVRIAGITRIRNEEHIISDALDHFAEFCNAGIFVFDDASTDRTNEICRDHPAVAGMISNDVWAETRSQRQAAEGTYRQQIFESAQKGSPDWIFCFDADERPELDLGSIDLSPLSGIRLRLFDFYITPDDEHLSWKERIWIGPEFRDILMLFKSRMVRGFPDREPHIAHGEKVALHGFVKHYGKAISIQEWETTCRYYADHLPEPYQTKWRNRIGRAVKSDYLSDFGNPLIRWDEKTSKGFPLTPSIESLERSRYVR